MIDKLNGELARILANPAVRENLVKQGAAPEHTTPEQFTTYLRSEIAKWRKIIAQAGIQAQ